MWGASCRLLSSGGASLVAAAAKLLSPRGRRCRKRQGCFDLKADGVVVRLGEGEHLDVPSQTTWQASPFVHPAGGWPSLASCPCGRQPRWRLEADRRSSGKRCRDGPGSPGGTPGRTSPTPRASGVDEGREGHTAHALPTPEVTLLCDGMGLRAWPLYPDLQARILLPCRERSPSFSRGFDITPPPAAAPRSQGSE